MHHVIADPVPPLHIMPVRSMLVILIEQMVLSIKIQRCMRFIHPVTWRYSMISGAEAVTVIDATVKTEVWRRQVSTKSRHVALIGIFGFSICIGSVVYFHFIDEPVEHI
ncbi:hypothetical protein D3C73_1295530 [compost metagenome]